MFLGIKLLAIGNSFSEDATAYLKKISDSAGIDVEITNLFVPGCSLEMDSDNLADNKPAFRLDFNGVNSDRYISIRDALKLDKWDIVTIQQESSRAGLIDSYYPYATELIDTIRQNVPDAKIYFHETWAYEIDCLHAGFVNYDKQQLKMFDKICQSVNRFCKENDGISYIPCGEVIQELRRHPAFDYQNGGESLCRDGFHMSLIYGRYALASTWFETLFGGDIFEADFLPQAEDVINGFTIDSEHVTDKQKIELIKQCVHNVCKQKKES